VRVEDQLDVIAHLSEAAPRLWFVDSPALQQFLTNELTYDLPLAVEAKPIADIAATSGIQTQAFSTSVLQTLRKSVTRLEANGYPPAVFVLQPNDWEAIRQRAPMASIELALLSTSAVEFQGLPFDAQRRTLWSLAVTVTNAQTAGVTHTLAQGAVGPKRGV
jgi:hypothetical protein